MEYLTPENLVALGTLATLEIVLGIDNVVFLSILTGRLPEHQQARGRFIGLLLAMLMRVGLLFAIKWVMGLTRELFSVAGMGFSGRDLILLGGGLFLVAKATFEIHHKLEGDSGVPSKAAVAASFASVMVQVVILDLVFSLDSVITAVGMADEIWVMIVAVVIAVVVMMVFAGAIGRFIERHPTMKMLALAFLILIGVMLITEGMGKHVGKGYIYFAMAFSLIVELLNMRVRTKLKDPVA